MSISLNSFVPGGRLSVRPCYVQSSQETSVPAHMLDSVIIMSSDFPDSHLTSILLALGGKPLPGTFLNRRAALCPSLTPEGSGRTWNPSHTFHWPSWTAQS